MFVGVGACARARPLRAGQGARRPASSSSTSSTPWARRARARRLHGQRGARADLESAPRGDGRLRARRPAWSIMAATNRPEILDRALLRAGRFDRQVLVDRPDVRGREAHPARPRQERAARRRRRPPRDRQRTPGMVGADLANVVNEAALAAVRRGGRVPCGMRDFEEAIDRIQLGLKKAGARARRGREAPGGVPRGRSRARRALGAARRSGPPGHHHPPLHRRARRHLQLPTEDRYLFTRGRAPGPHVRPLRRAQRRGDGLRRRLHRRGERPRTRQRASRARWSAASA